MPKQFITVYLGVLLEQSETGMPLFLCVFPDLMLSQGVTDTKSRIISDVVLAVTFIITIAAMWWIYRKMGACYVSYYNPQSLNMTSIGQVKAEVIYARRKAR